jgi:hypothetical protein
MNLTQRLFTISKLADFLAGLGNSFASAGTAPLQTSDPVLVGARDIVNCNRTPDTAITKIVGPRP